MSIKLSTKSIELYKIFCRFHIPAYQEVQSNGTMIDKL